jgi:hypothetical protein
MMYRKILVHIQSAREKLSIRKQEVNRRGTAYVYNQFGAIHTAIVVQDRSQWGTSGLTFFHVSFQYCHRQPTFGEGDLDRPIILMPGKSQDAEIIHTKPVMWIQTVVQL